MILYPETIKTKQNPTYLCVLCHNCKLYMGSTEFDKKLRCSASSVFKGEKKYCILEFETKQESRFYPHECIEIIHLYYHYNYYY